MNIASSAPASATPTTAPSSPSARTVDPAIAGPDAAPDATSDPSAGAAFGQVLSRTMASGLLDAGAAASDANALASVPDAAIGPNGLPALMTTVSVDGAADGAASIAPDAASVVAPPKVGPGRIVGKDDDGRDTRPEPDAVASDLAAQLALVSQWASVAKPVVPTESATGGASATVASGEIKAKLDTIRTTSFRPTVAAGSKGVDATSVAAGGGRIARDTAMDAAASSAIPTSTGALAAVDARVRGDGPTGADRLNGDGFVGRLETALGATSDPSASLAATSAQATTSANGSAMLAATTAPMTAAQPAAAAAQTGTLHAPVGTSAWSQEVGQATLRLAAGDLQTASLRLNPEHLGPMEVQVRVADGVAHLAFTAAHAETRQAIEASRPTLDAMFADQGLSIGGCAVGDSASSQRRFDADGAAADRARRDDGAGGANGTRETVDSVASTTTTRLLRGLGMVDTFA